MAMLEHCPSCGGVIGRDCWNPDECAQITNQMQYGEVDALRADLAAANQRIAELTTISDEAVERAAREIASTESGWDHYDMFGQSIFLRYARAALEAFVSSVREGQR